MSGGSGGSELGLFGVDFATTKNGNKRSLASQIRFRKTLQATIPPTLLLDGRLAKDLQPVKEPKQKLEEIRSGPVTAVEPENEVPKLTDARLLAEIQKFKFPRNPAMENQLLILEPVLCDFVKKFSRAQLKELFQRLYARACLVVAALQRKYQLKEEALSAKGVFHPAANHSRCQSMMQVELRRIRLDMLEVDVLEEMAYEEAERRWREAHPDGEEPPMDSDNIVLGTIRNPNAGAKSAAQVAAEKRRILEKEASQQRWSMQSTVDPAVRTRALGGAMNAKFVKQRSAKTSKLIGAPLTASQIRPWRPSKKMSRAKAAAAAANAATIAQSGELEEADSSNDKSPLGTTESAAGVDDSHNVDAKLRSSQSSHSPARPGALALRSGSSSGENDHAQQLLSIWKQLEVPVALQYQFLCKYSEPRYAGELQNVIADLNKVCELIVCREDLLSSMRSLQKGAKLGMDDVLPEGSTTMDVLVRYDCFISATDLFGVTVFIRLAHILSKLDDVLATMCKKLDDQYDEAAYFRGHKYSNVLAEAAPMVADWLDNPRNWRTLPVPPACTYLVNPFLRRLGIYVA